MASRYNSLTTPQQFRQFPQPYLKLTFQNIGPVLSYKTVDGVRYVKHLKKTSIARYCHIETRTSANRDASLRCDQLCTRRSDYLGQHRTQINSVMMVC